MRTSPAIILTAFLFSAMPVLSHEAKGPNGGQIVDAGDHHVELVAKGSSVEVYVTDSGDKPVAAEALKGVAILLVGGRSQRIELISGGGNKLHGSATASIDNAKGVVRITLPGGKTVQGQYK